MGIAAMMPSIDRSREHMRGYTPSVACRNKQTFDHLHAFGLRVPIMEVTSPEVGKAVNGGFSPTFNVGTQHHTRTLGVDMWDRCQTSVK